VRHLATRPGPIQAVVRYFDRRRALLPFFLSTGYVAAHSVRADHGRGAPVWLGSVLALGVAFFAAGPSVPGNHLRDDGRRRVGLLAFALWGLALAIASSTSTTPALSQGLSGEGAALLGSVTAVLALGALPRGQGIVASLPRSRGLVVVALVVLSVLFGLALLASILALRGEDGAAWDPVPYVHACASGGALLVLAAATWETLREQRLVLGSGDRAMTSLGVVIAVSVVAIAVSVLGDVAADRVLRVGVTAAAVLVATACTTGDAESHARLGRRALALLLFGGPVVLLGALAAEGPNQRLIALAATGLVSLAIGSAVSYLEEPLRPAEGRLLDAAGRANLALVRADPDTSLRDALAGLRPLAVAEPQSPELWSVAPPVVRTIDAAGYPSAREATLPPLLVETAADEPEATVRTELLEALVVRRPDLRPLARWMDERGALCATLVAREGEVEGVLILPRGPRRQPMSLEEVRAVKRVADAFAGALAGEAALLRSLARERDAVERADRADERLLARELGSDLAGARAMLMTSHVAEPALGGPYSPAARLAFDAIERRLGIGAPVVVLTPPGSDVVPYLARAHLGTRRRGGPFVVVHGGSTVEHDLCRWNDPARSPLALADGGLLVLADAHRLPHDVQRLIAEALSLRHAPWERPTPVDLVLAVTACGTSVEVGRALDPALGTRLELALAAGFEWPHLAERGEDLRSLVLAGLAREGVRVHGSPLGIDDAAYARLAEYSFPGEETELASLLQRLIVTAEPPLVRLRDVEALHLPPPARPEEIHA